jgi:MFS family permease
MHARQDEIDSRSAWLRLLVSLMIGSIGSIGMWSFVVALPAVQAEFGVTRADASLPYTLSMVGFGIGGVVMGRLADRFGIVLPIVLGAVCLCAGYVLSGLAPNLWLLSFAHLVIGLGVSASFGPLLADISFWFARRRGIAIAICSSGNYLAGTLWPPLIQYFIGTSGWRPTHIGIGILCIISNLVLVGALRRRAPAHVEHVTGTGAAKVYGIPGLKPGTLQTMLGIAALACCVAMAMPQVHIVAYCSDLGYGVARGAEMLSLMLAFGIVSRVGSGYIADRIGGLPALLLGSVLQAVALVLYAMFDGLASLYVISALFGLFQGGIVPMYAVTVREYFPPQEAGTRVGVVLVLSLAGMALGGWMSGVIFDLTGSYQIAFLNGSLWNLLNIAIVGWLLIRSGWWSRPKLAPA